MNCENIVKTIMRVLLNSSYMITLLAAVNQLEGTSMSQDDHHHQSSCSWSSLHWSSEWCGLRHAEHYKTDTTINRG